MKTVTLTELKNNFSALMDRVKRGKESLLVFERSVPVIRVVYAGGETAEERQKGVLPLRLERAGLLRRLGNSSSQLSLTELRQLRLKPRQVGVDAVAALLAEREEGR